MAKVSSVIFELVVPFGVTWLENTTIKQCPVDHVITGLKVPIQKHVCSWVPVAHRITRRQERSVLTQINAKVWERLIMRAAVWRCTTNKIVHFACTNSWSEGLNLGDRVRILPNALFAERTKEVKGTIFIHVILVNEFSRPFHRACHCLGLLMMELIFLRLLKVVSLGCVGGNCSLKRRLWSKAFCLCHCGR